MNPMPTALPTPVSTPVPLFDLVFKNPSILMFAAFVLVTLGITYWAAKKATGASGYFAAGRSIKGWQNGIAVAGDYIMGASTPWPISWPTA
jgi:Na+(H+)/acetate symporter ActP